MNRPTQIPEGQLQEREVAVVGHARDAQEGRRAGLGRDDRDHHGPGRDVALAQEIPLQALRPRAQPGPQRGTSGDIDGDHGQVDGIHSGGVSAGSRGNSRSKAGSRTVEEARCHTNFGIRPEIARTDRLLKQRHWVRTLVMDVAASGTGRAGLPDSPSPSRQRILPDYEVETSSHQERLITDRIVAKLDGSMRLRRRVDRSQGPPSDRGRRVMSLIPLSSKLQRIHGSPSRRFGSPNRRRLAISRLSRS